MPELTAIYYTANLVPEPFAAAVREHLLATLPKGTPIISVSHRPLAFGRNICVGEIGVSTYNVYRQVLLGAMAAATEFVACCEDDTLYSPDHFAHRPPADEFHYNKNRWWVEPQGVFRWRDRSAMHACIAPRELMVETLTTRFAAYPEPLTTKRELRSWGEPGRYEGNLNLPQVRRDFFRTKTPILTFDRKGSLYGLRRWQPEDTIVDELEPWGSARNILTRFHYV